jgi:hypothetical protein
MKRVYLSGPMTGLPDFNFPAFNVEAERLRRRDHLLERVVAVGGRGVVVKHAADVGFLDEARKTGCWLLVAGCWPGVGR